MENYQTLIHQAEIAINKNDLLTAENLYFSIYKTAEKNLDFEFIFWALQKIMEIFPTKFKPKIIKNYFSYFMFALSESAENEHFQKLQNALQNQQNKNMNLQIMMAKILIFHAQNTQNFTDEYQKLLLAKNLIRNLDFEYANYCKAQIELYLARNCQKSLNQKFSTRNPKKFLEKSQQIWQNNKTQIAKNFPNLAFFDDEIKEFENIKIIVFFTNGRAGSNFVHSLLDGYPKIATFPGFCLLNFFDPQILTILFPPNIFDKSNWQEDLIQKFIQIFAMSFDGDAKGYLSDLGNFFGLCEMGENANQILRVNKKAFADFLLNELKNRQKISVAGFFILVHFAYEFASGRLTEKSQKSVIFYDPHVFNSKNLHKFCVAFPNAKYLNIIREPINMLESSARLCINAIDPIAAKSALAHNLTPKNLLEYGGKDLYFAWKFMMREFSIQKFSIELFLHFGFENSATIRLEDIKNNPKTALLNLLSWFGIENPKWNDCLTKETFAGFLYGGTSQNNIKGFDNSHLKKRGTFFSENDLRIMKLLLYPIAVKFGYRQKDDDFLNAEISWYENDFKVETYMDFERKIIERLKQDFPNLENSQMMAPYFYRVKYAKRNISIMKKYSENCVGFADFLKL